MLRTTQAKPIVICLSQGEYLSFSELKEHLISLGYTRVPMVVEPGEFAVRGSIVDIFACGHSSPLRLEYFGDELERLSSFSTATQRSLVQVDETFIDFIDSSSRDAAWVNPEMVNEELLADIQVDDLVVHEDYGIGVYKGLVRRQFRGMEGEFVHIQYLGEDRLFVPLDQMHLVHRYSGAESRPKVHALYDGKWQRTKTRVQRVTEVMAEEVYRLYKLRQEQPGFSCSDDSELQLDLEQSFGYSETQDQLKAIQAIKQDMESAKPMDRLLCGDVGFGKTEVILRAAFKAVDNGKQVAVLVPTTVLAEQHYQVFSQRFSKLPVSVEVLSRFRSRQDQKAALERLANGRVDVMIGTHRLLQKDVSFSELGLVVIDEEQRFGVGHKEKLKAKAPQVDVLSVSATPIPRTLYMALTGGKDLSVIQTPPQARKPVMTTIRAFDEDVVKEACFKELTRGGQVFYIYNNVQGMVKKFEMLKRLLPGVSIAYAHGQMAEGELYQTMRRFWKKEIQVLLSSTIIENGLDVPDANTIIIDQVDRFGLAQIHQLRGRVGRTPRQGYALFLYKDEALLSEVAKERLSAVKDYSQLGSGYRIALRDLELRGAGSMLGKVQHGHMTQVGFELYCKLLEHSIHRVKGERIEVPNQLTFELKPGVAAYIPESYVASDRERLALYKRLMRLEFRFELDELVDELTDRYGKPPELLTPLFSVIEGQLKG